MDQSGGRTPWADLEIHDADFDIAALHSPLTKGVGNGQRTAFPQVMRLSRWLRSPAASLTRIAHW